MPDEEMPDQEYEPEPVIEPGNDPVPVGCYQLIEWPLIELRGEMKMGPILPPL